MGGTGSTGVRIHVHMHAYGNPHAYANGARAPVYWHICIYWCIRIRTLMDACPRIPAYMHI